MGGERRGAKEATWLPSGLHRMIPVAGGLSRLPRKVALVKRFGMERPHTVYVGKLGGYVDNLVLR